MIVSCSILEILVNYNSTVYLPKSLAILMSVYFVAIVYCYCCLKQCTQLEPNYQQGIRRYLFIFILYVNKIKKANVVEI